MSSFGKVEDMNVVKKSSLRARAEAAGIPYKTVYTRIKRGWSEEKALSMAADSEEKPKVNIGKAVTKENVEAITVAPKVRGGMRDAFEVCYGVKFVPGPWPMRMEAFQKVI